ncbi:hypothetical protein N482_24445 [Pseudoalteromonas luteoviolacea NCIMB 1942]|uniref:Uncharacterized protein n=1 Tax=Pseudoalteromonas luteoviolacea NCIMB 1942 TaxID=1365253 RepID=A0A167G9W7_9GAMM|nr:hypothetical protein N482_24445 [Pseudoalteromonas luteoviolacea NCIMB 1942]
MVIYYCFFNLFLLKATNYIIVVRENKNQQGKTIQWFIMNAKSVLKNYMLRESHCLSKMTKLLTNHLLKYLMQSPS